MTDTNQKLWIDPPSGWMYGFPQLWDQKEEPRLEDFLVKNGYPVDQVDFAVQYIRVWKEEV